MFSFQTWHDYFLWRFSFLSTCPLWDEYISFSPNWNCVFFFVPRTTMEITIREQHNFLSLFSSFLFLIWLVSHDYRNKKQLKVRETIHDTSVFGNVLTLLKRINFVLWIFKNAFFVVVGMCAIIVKSFFVAFSTLVFPSINGRGMEIIYDNIVIVNVCSRDHAFDALQDFQTMCDDSDFLFGQTRARWKVFMRRNERVNKNVREGWRKLLGSG